MSRQNSFRRAFTLVEMLISLILLGVLFTLLGGLLSGMSRISRMAEDDFVRDREMSFCFDLIRKELGEMIVEQGQESYRFLSGENFVAYTTTRQELLARNSIPGGAKRVEWRYDPSAQKLIRTTSMLIDGKREVGLPSVTPFLEGLAGLEIYFFDKVEWQRMTGISELVPQTSSIAIRFIFDSETQTGKQEIFESAFILPNEIFVKE